MLYYRQLFCLVFETKQFYIPSLLFQFLNQHNPLSIYLSIYLSIFILYLYIYFIWTTSEKELDDFFERLNNFHPNLKFTHEHSREEINFFDVTVRNNHGELITNLYCKPTDGHQYLHLSHPSHTKSSIIFSQVLRMRRI